MIQSHVVTDLRNDVGECRPLPLRWPLLAYRIEISSRHLTSAYEFLAEVTAHGSSGAPPCILQIALDVPTLHGGRVSRTDCTRRLFSQSSNSE